MGAPLAERVLLGYARRFPLRKGKLRAVNALWRAAAGGAGTEAAELLAGFGYLFVDAHAGGAPRAYGEWMRGVYDVMAVRGDVKNWKGREVSGAP